MASGHRIELGLKLEERILAVVRRGVEAALESSTTKPALLSYLSTSQYVGGDISVETVRTWVRQGLLPKVRIGRRCFVPRAAIDRLIAEQLEEDSE